MPITINTNTRAVAKAEAKKYLEESCQSLPKMTEIPHWTALKDPKYHDVWFGVGSDYWARTHGGLPHGFYLSSREEYSTLRNTQYTGNFFKLKQGNLVWIGNCDTAEYKQIVDKNLLSDPLTFEINRGEYYYLQGDVDVPTKGRATWQAGWYHFMFKEGKTLHLNRFRSKTDVPNQNGISYVNWLELLTKLENANIPKDKNIVIGYWDKGIISSQQIALEVSNFLESPLGKIAVSSGLVAFGIPPQQANEYITNVASLSKTIANGQMPSTQQIMMASAGLIPEGLASYINPAQKLIDAYGTKDPIKMAQVAMELGVTPSKIGSLLGYGRTKEGSIGGFYDGLKPGSNLTNSNNLLTTYKIGGYVLDAQTKATASMYYDKIINKDGTINSPLVQNASTLSLGDSLTTTTPNIDNIVRAMIESKILTDNREKRNAIQQATGRQELDTKLPNSSLTSMILQAETCARNSEPYILPSEIPQEYRRCYSASITAETGIPIIDKSVTPPEKKGTGTGAKTTGTQTNRLPPKSKKSIRKEYL